MPKGNTRPKTKTKRTRRPRRSTEEIIDRLMEAACEEFERTGYAGTTTAAIAKKAGVVEALIYSNFGSKAKLFQDSIFKPLNRHLLEFCATHLVDPGDPNTFRQNTRQYILELQHFIERHSGMMISLVGAQMFEHDNVEGLGQLEGLEEYFSQSTALAQSNLGKNPTIDPMVLSRISFATMLACVLFKDWLFPKRIVTKAGLSTAIGNFIMDGLNANASRLKAR